MERESMTFDVAIIGAGPAGLAAACRLMQLSKDKPLSVCVLEKGSEVGAHIVSGAVLEPTALNELFPDWQERQAPLQTPVKEDVVYLLRSATQGVKIPDFFLPSTLKNHGNYIISLGQFCRWLGLQAEGLGVEIFPGFAAQSLLLENNVVRGIVTGDMGLARDGGHKAGYTPGVEIRAQYCIFAEGSRGHLGKELLVRFKLDKGCDPQHYALGIKELWTVPKSDHKEGLIVHTAGWPLRETHAQGGGFLYHMAPEQVAVGLITDLSYTNPFVSPFEEFQRFKMHPLIKGHLQNGHRVAYGGRSITKGGPQSLPQMSFPGGLIIGCDAGTLNCGKIKGTHTAMKSGMLAAETIFKHLGSTEKEPLPLPFEPVLRRSWLYKELHTQRNFNPYLHKFGPILGAACAFVDINLFKGRLPWTLRCRQADFTTLHLAKKSAKPHYPKADNKLTFDRLSSVFLANLSHDEDQPCHLKLADPNLPIVVNLPKWAEPAQRYCPAGVYEVLMDDDKKSQFVINGQNCIHCKTCDIKDPSQNITWVPPEGSSGPNYPNM